MILRNPAQRRDSFFRTLLLTVALCLSTVMFRAQGILGTVVEEFSRQVIANAEIQISIDDSLLQQGLTDSLGHYTFHTTSAGRVEIRIVAAGYSSLVEHDVILDGYSTLRLEHLLKKNAFDLPAVTVIATQKQSSPAIRSITADDIVTVAGNFDDPVRVGHSQPGIVLLNDQTNQFSFRGQSPVFNTWFLEGLEIVNPNHTNNAGTFSDQPTQSGGGVNMFSAQVLGTTDLYSGISPMKIMRNAGAVIDMHLHESPKPEFRAKASLLGLEFGGGIKPGPLTSLDFNFRYSFTGILTSLGADFGGEKINFYDGVLSFNKQGIKAKLKLFAWLGASENNFEKVDDPAKRERYKDFFDILYENSAVGLGFNYDYTLGPKFNLKSGASFSKLVSTYDRSGHYNSELVSLYLYQETNLLSTRLELQYAASSRIQLTGGLTSVHRGLVGSPDDIVGPFIRESILRPFLNAGITLLPKLTAEIGGEINYSLLSSQDAVNGYRLNLKWQTGNYNYLYAGFRHAPGQSVLNEYSNTKFLVDKSELGWKMSKEHLSLDFIFYYQEINNLTTFTNIAPVIHLADYMDGYFVFSDRQEAEGHAKYYGVEGDIKFSTSNAWSFNFNQTVYRSQTAVEDGPFIGGRFDGRYASHLAISKEIIKTSKGKNRIWNISLRALLNGGLWEETIDQEASAIAAYTVFNSPRVFNMQLPAYTRVDFGLARTIAHEKIRWRYSLDVQNVFGLTNIAYHYYDPFLEKVVVQDQLGIIPVLSVQASW